MRSASAAESVAALLAALTLAVGLVGLGDADVTGDDEAREVGVVQDILAGNLFAPTFNGELIPDKPILFHWIAAGSAAVFGFSEAAVRLPSTLATSAAVGATTLLAARLADPLAGVVAGTLLLTTFSVFERARVARPDTLLLVLLTLALALTERWWARRDRRAATGALVVLGAAMATKGPVAPTIFAVTLVGFLAWQRDLRRLRDFPTAAGVAGFLVLGFGWYAIALAAWGREFVDQHIVGRYLRNLAGGLVRGERYSSRSLWYHATFYPLHLPLAALPWTPLVATACWQAWRQGALRDAHVRFLVCWALAPVVVFTPAEWKLRYYLLPSLPALAILAAPLGADLLRRRQRAGATRASLVAGAVTLAASAGAILLVLARPDLLSGADQSRIASLTALVPASRVTLAALLGVAGGFLATSVALRAWDIALGATALAMLLWVAAGAPALAAAESRATSLRAIAETAGRRFPTAAPLAFWGEPIRQVVVYAGRHIPSVGRRRADLQPGMGLLVPEPAYRRLAAEGFLGLPIARQRGRLVNARPGTLVLAPVVERPP